MEACVGDIRLKGGHWWALTNHLNHDNPLDITYCEYCVTHQCVDINTLYEVQLDNNLNYNINCDCPHKRDHQVNDCCIKPFVCASHKTKEGRGMIMTCCMGECKHCHHYTSSGGIKLCDGCSYTLQICRYCGQ